MESATGEPIYLDDGDDDTETGTQLIRACIDRYAQEFGHRRASTVWHVNQAINNFLTVMPLHENMLMREITKPLLAEYKNRLLNGLAHGHTKRKKPSAVTISKKLGLLSGWLGWATKNDYLDKNPVDGLQLPARLVASQKTRKRGFTDAELITILKALAPHRHSSDPRRIEFYWITLVLMFTGARLSEIVQLLPSDIRLVEGVWVINLEESDTKELKNKASVRVVPIHSQLIEAGFLDWFKSRPPADKVFPAIVAKESTKVSLWFALLLEKAGIKEPAIFLHSFRHTMTVRLEKARVHTSITHRLLGHRLGAGVEGQVYLASLTYSPEVEIEKVQFPAVLKASAVL